MLAFLGQLFDQLFGLIIKYVCSYFLYWHFILIESFKSFFFHYLILVHFFSRIFLLLSCKFYKFVSKHVFTDCRKCLNKQEEKADWLPITHISLRWTCHCYHGPYNDSCQMETNTPTWQSAACSNN